MNAGVDETQVKAFHKNELDCRLLKLQQIDQLLKWFGENKNRRFDYTMFLNKNDGLLMMDVIASLSMGLKMKILLLIRCICQ